MASVTKNKTIHRCQKLSHINGQSDRTTIRPCQMLIQDNHNGQYDHTNYKNLFKCLAILMARVNIQ